MTHFGESVNDNKNTSEPVGNGKIGYEIEFHGLFGMSIGFRKMYGLCLDSLERKKISQECQMGEISIRDYLVNTNA